MSAAQEIADYAASLFDAVGFTRLPSGSELLILGLESTAQCDLDEYGLSDVTDSEGHRLLKYGWQKHVIPRLDSLLEFVQSKGFSAEPVGRYGHPPWRRFNLKEAAIRAGLGKRGKSTVVLHPRYGPRLRLSAVKIEAPLESSIKSLPDEENPLCNDCSICIDVCPVKALEPYRMPDASPCLSNIGNAPLGQSRLVFCDLCLIRCPANQSA